MVLRCYRRELLVFFNQYLWSSFRQFPLLQVSIHPVELLRPIKLRIKTVPKRSAVDEINSKDNLPLFLAASFYIQSLLQVFLLWALNTAHVVFCTITIYSSVASKATSDTLFNVVFSLVIWYQTSTIQLFFINLRGTWLFSTPTFNVFIVFFRSMNVRSLYHWRALCSSPSRYSSR